MMSRQTIIHTIADMRVFTSEAGSADKTIGLVPTMGALHEGHLSLIRRSTDENDITVASVFVNPIQFDDPEDLSAYPQTLESDSKSAFEAGADAIFAPSAAEMYPAGFSTFVDMTGISEKLCGASRPSFFRGVLTVVSKLFGIVAPDRAYFGEKDAQQLEVVKKMANELCMNIEIIGCPTVREKDGLAMSSRNSRLTGRERTSARSLYTALTEAEKLFAAGETNPLKLKAAMIRIIEKEPCTSIEYALIVDPATFESVKEARRGDLLALAVDIGGVRLIDSKRLKQS